MADRLGKKGITELQLFLIAEYFLAGLIIYALWIFIANAASNAVFEQNFMARDLGLLTDTLYASPGNISIIYDTTIKENKLIFKEFFPETKFNFLFGESRVNVYTTDDVLEKPVLYRFGEDDAVDLTPTERLRYNLIFKRVQDELTVESLGQTIEEASDE